MTLEAFNNIVNYISDLIAGTEFENKVYVVGGACRDIILHANIKDIDLVVSLPDGGIRLAEWLADNNLLTSKNPKKFTSFGTTMFHLKQFPDIELEAVQTRNEEYINRDSRKPATMYGTIEEDCTRRDLTINCLYYNISTKEFVDVCKRSLNDIENKIIRTPADPDITYKDDPLRILRCIRFSCRYGWPIDSETYEGMRKNVDRITIVSKERVMSEFNQIIMSPNYAMGMNYLFDLKLMNYIIPNFWIDEVPMYTKAVDPVNYLKEKTIPKIFVFLIRGSHNHSLYMLRFENSVTRNIEDIKRIMKTYEPVIYDKWNTESTLNDAAIRELQYICKTRKMFDDVLDCINAAWFGKMSDIILNITEATDRMEREGTLMFGYKLPITGDDIMSLGIPAGKEIRNIQKVLVSVAFSNVNIDKDFCINYIKDNMKQYSS